MKITSFIYLASSDYILMAEWIKVKEKTVQKNREKL